MFDKIQEEIEIRKQEVIDENIKSKVYIINDTVQNASSYASRFDVPLADFCMTSPPYNTNMKYLDDTSDFNTFISDDLIDDEYVFIHGNIIRNRLPNLLLRGANVVYNMFSGIGRTEFSPLSTRIINETLKNKTSHHMYFRGFKIWDKSHVSCRDIAVGSIYNKPSWTDQFEFLLSWRYTNDDRRGIKGQRPTSTFKWFMNKSILKIMPETKKIKINKNHNHPAPYPKKLVEPFILYYTRKREVVLDHFAGTGTTGQVAIDLGCDVVLIDQSKTYCQYMSQQFLQRGCEVLFL